jgi:hypothetical protein
MLYSYYAIGLQQVGFAERINWNSCKHSETYEVLPTGGKLTRLLMHSTDQLFQLSYIHIRM